MKHEHIDDRARVWVVTLGADGRIEEQLDPDLLAQLVEARSAEDVSEALTEQVAKTRTW